MDKLLLVGVNHKVAPAALRERLAFSPDGVVEAVKQLQTQLSLANHCEASADAVEVALLSTCNRTEVILLTPNPCKAEELVRHFLSEKGQITENTLEDVLYIHHGCDAANHLLCVAAGLDSLVVGENEIQGQVRNAYEMAQEAGTCGPYLNTLFRAAAQCGKRVRSETEIGKTKLSIATVVVGLAAEQFGDLQQHTALLIGAGKISTLTAKELVRAGLRCVLVANRTFERAQKLASSLGTGYARAIHFDHLGEELRDADIVICSTGAPHTVLHRREVAKAMEMRADKPLLVVDLAIPRDVDEAVRDVPNVMVYAVDDLSGLVQERYPVTAEAWRSAHLIIEAELSAYADWCEARRAAPLIQSLRNKADAIAQGEIERTLRRLAPLSAEQQAAIENLGKAIVNKLLHDPTICLKNQPDLIQHKEQVELVQALFGLDQSSGSS